MTAGCSLNLVCGFSYNFFSRLHAFLIYGFVPHHHQGCILSRLFRHFSQVTLNEVKPHEKQNKPRIYSATCTYVVNLSPIQYFLCLYLFFSPMKIPVRVNMRQMMPSKQNASSICVLSSPSIHLAPTMYV